LEYTIQGKIFSPDSERSERKVILYRSIAIVLLFSMTIYMVYLAPLGIDKLFCAILFVLFWYSKSNYFWFAFFLIVSSFPAGLFTETTGLATRRLPIYSPVPLVSFSVMDLFLIIAFVKALLRGKKIMIVDVFKIKKIVYIIPYILVISFFYGFTLKLFLNQTIRGLFFYTLLYSLPALISNKKELYKFMLMFFPFVFIEIIAQLYIIRTGNEFASLFNPGTGSELYNSMTGDIRAIPTGYIVMRLAFVFAFVLLECKDVMVPRIYLLLIILFSISSVIIAATRSAIIMLIFIFISYFVFVAKRKPNIVIQVFITGAIIVMLLDITNVFNLNHILDSSYNRFIGAVKVEEGTVKAADSFENRVSNRLPVLLDAIKGSVFVGYGFSDNYFIFYDGHLGGVLIGLLQVGIFGYLVYIVFITNIFRKCFFYIRKFSDNNPYKSQIKVFLICFFGYMIVNLTVDPIFVLNTSMMPQDIFIHLVVATFFINLAMRYHLMKRAERREEIEG
jgi:hypothetical protein